MLAGLVFLALITLVIGLIHVYLWRRLVKDTTWPGRARRLGGWLIIAGAVLIPATFIATRIIGPTVGQWLAWPGYLWLAMVFYLLVGLLVLEIPRAIAGRLLTTQREERKERKEREERDKIPPDVENTERRLFLSRAIAGVVGVAAAGTVGYGVREAMGDPLMLRVPITLKGLDPGLAGLRIAVVSDMHLGAILGRAHTERIVRMINRTQPDLVAIVGDLVDGSVRELGQAVRPLQGLDAQPYFVTGNHEYYSGVDEWSDELQSLGVRTLRNERVEITRGGAVLDLAGVDDVTGSSIGEGGPDFAKALRGRPKTRPVVLLAHQPVVARMAADHGVDLQLSGHTHGGQLYPFNYVVPLQQPIVAGLGRVGDTQVYVTRGVGFWGPPVRVGAPPDITVVELR